MFPGRQQDEPAIYSSSLRKDSQNEHSVIVKKCTLCITNEYNVMQVHTFYGE